MFMNECCMNVICIVQNKYIKINHSPPGQVEDPGVVLLPVGDEEAIVHVPHHAEHSAHIRQSINHTEQTINQFNQRGNMNHSEELYFSFGYRCPNFVGTEKLCFYS
jgi:hypothetical protein